MAQIIKRGDDRFLVKVFLGRDARGKRLYHCKTITGTKKDADKYARSKEHARDTGTLRKPLNLTLNDLLDQWLKRKRGLRESTKIHYDNLMRLYVRPHLGDMKLTALTPLDFEDLYIKLEKQGLSGRTIRHAHARLKTAFNQALKWELLAHSPIAQATAPQIVKREMDYLKPEEAKRFLAASREDARGVLLRFALLTGMRPEEYCGLTWAEIEIEGTVRGVARVRRVMKWFREKRWKFDEPKTKSSRRDVYFPVSMARDLQEHRRQQLEERMRLGKHYQNNDLVFADESGQPLTLNRLTNQHLWPTLGRAELRKVSLYALRHSYVTLSLASGVSAKTVSEQAGHSSVEFTLDTYAHVLPEDREGASDRLEKLLFSRVGEQ
jgi:integrase